jgi:hypothetical protein
MVFSTKHSLPYAVKNIISFNYVKLASKYNTQKGQVNCAIKIT